MYVPFESQNCYQKSAKVPEYRTVPERYKAVLGTEYRSTGLLKKARYGTVLQHQFGNRKVTDLAGVEKEGHHGR
jgi:hypothetical protein